jgi:intracellular septation protein A
MLDSPSLATSIAKLTGLYVAATVVAIAATCAAAALQNASDSRVCEMSMLIVFVYVLLWVYGVFHIVRGDRNHA